MSVDQQMPFLRDAAEFDFGIAEGIAREVALGASVSELHENAPEQVPSPIIVNRWRKQVPAFDFIMREAEQAKAERLADQVIGISDNQNLVAGQAANAIKARRWLAGQLSESFRNGARHEGGGGIVVQGDIRLTDEALMRIASGKYDAKFIEGEVVEESASLVGPAVVEHTVESKSAAPEAGGSVGEVVEGRESSISNEDGDSEEDGWGFL